MSTNKFSPKVISFSDINKNKESELNDTKSKLINAKKIAKQDLSDIQTKFEAFISSLQNNCTASVQYIETMMTYHNLLCDTTKALIDQNKDFQDYLGNSDYTEARTEFYKALLASIKDKENNKE